MGRISLRDVCGIIEGGIIKRRAMGRDNGVAIVAEGIGEKLDTEELAGITGGEMGYDAYGNLRLGDIPLATVIKRDVQQRFALRGERLTVADVTLGYELRCARPIPFDIDYTRTLGYGAIHFLLSEPTDERLRYGGLVYLDSGRLHILPFDEMRDPVTGRTRVRLVDIGSEHYNVAREYMIRLEPPDLQDPKMLGKLAAAANMTPEEFESTFAHVTSLSGGDSPRLMPAAR